MCKNVTDEKICPFMSRGFIAFVDDIGDCETGLLVQKFKLIDMKAATPEWCPLEENK